MLAFLDAVTSTSHCHLLSDPADLNFTEPREVLQLCHEIEHTFIGLNNGTGNAQHQMMQQFAAGSASITCNKGVVLACDKARKAGVAIAEEALALDDRPLMAALTAAAVAALSRTDDDFSACTCPMRWIQPTVSQILPQTHSRILSHHFAVGFSKVLSQNTAVFVVGFCGRFAVGLSRISMETDMSFQLSVEKSNWPIRSSDKSSHKCMLASSRVLEKPWHKNMLWFYSTAAFKTVQCMRGVPAVSDGVGIECVNLHSFHAFVDQKFEVLHVHSTVDIGDDH